MKLTDFARSDTSVKSTTTIPLNTAQAQSVSRQIKALAPGQTIQGEVISRNGNEVQLRLGDEVVINARLNQNIQLELGKLLTFEVKNNGQALTLSPLFANMATDVNVLKALDMAGLPVNKSTISMTSQMMEAGLPVDRNTLQQVFREMNVYGGGEAGSVIALHQLGLPVNEQNVQQMQAYQNLTHQLMGGIQELADELMLLLSERIQGSTDQGLVLFGQLAELAASAQEQPEQLLASDGQTAAGEGQTAAGENAGIMHSSGEKQGNVIQNQGEMQIPASVEQPSGKEQGGNAALWNQSVTEGLREILLTIPQEDAAVAGMAERLTALEQGQLSAQEQLQLLAALWKHGQSQEGKQVWSRLLGEDQLTRNFAQSIKEHLTISPQELSQSGKLDEFYQKLNQQMKGMERILAENGQSNSGAGRTVANLNQNVDFLQQLNQMYTYVQLPLKMIKGEAHGELYVYTNKKHLAAAEGQVSALLHLDMEHLGPVDVYVALTGQKVNTKFYLRDDGMLDFLSDHMEMLTARLEKGGYQTNVEMQTRSQGEAVHSGVEPLLPKGTGVPLAEYAFDVRA